MHSKEKKKKGEKSNDLVALNIKINGTNPQLVQSNTWFHQIFPDVQHMKMCPKNLKMNIQFTFANHCSIFILFFK